MMLVVFGTSECTLEFKVISCVAYDGSMYFDIDKKEK